LMLLEIVIPSEAKNLLFWACEEHNRFFTA